MNAKSHIGGIGSSIDVRAQGRRRSREDRWAHIVAAVVAVLGLIVVVAPTLQDIGDVFSEDPSEVRTVTVVREADGKKETQTTTTRDDESFLDRALSPGTLLLFRIGVVAFAAFLAGAVTQRTIAGDFSGKFGPLELERRAAAASSTTIAHVARQLEAQMVTTRRTAAVAAEAARRVRELELRSPET